MMPDSCDSRRGFAESSNPVHQIIGSDQSSTRDIIFT